MSLAYITYTFQLRCIKRAMQQSTTTHTFYFALYVIFYIHIFHI